MKIITTLCISLLFLNCGAKKTTATEVVEDAENIEKTMDKGAMMAEGYLPGIIRISESENGCPFVIEVENPDGNYMLDPINLEGESFKADGTKIWFKFTGLRMANRCPNANPISLNEIQKRAE